jgi:flavodoxin
MVSGHERKLKALTVYYSATGNTRKVADAIHQGLLGEEVEATLCSIEEGGDKDFYDYDLVFLGSPSIEFLPAAPMMRFIKDKMNLHRARGDIKLGAPKIPGKTAVVFCTYSGPHTGRNEVITSGKYMAQLFEHIGFDVADEWYVVGEFHEGREINIMGRLGDIRGRPNEEDLARVRNDVSNLVRAIRARDA